MLVADGDVVVVDGSAEHDESGTAAGVVVVGLVVVVVGSELVEVVVVEPVVVVSALWVGVVVGGVVLADVVVSELLAGQPVLALLGVVVAAGVVDPASTVESVCVWVRPGGSAGVVLAFVTALVVAVACLGAVLTAGLTAGLCAVVATGFFGAGLCGVIAARCSIFGRTAGAWVTVCATAGGLGIEATWLVVAAAW